MPQVLEDILLVDGRLWKRVVVLVDINPARVARKLLVANAKNRQVLDVLVIESVEHIVPF